MVIAGGRAPEYLPLNEKAIDIVKYFMENNKPVAAICHAPQLLAAVGGRPRFIAAFLKVLGVKIEL